MTEIETNDEQNKKEILEHVDVNYSVPRTAPDFEVITMGINTFFEKLFDYPFVINVYPKIFSIGGAIVNRKEAEQIYKRRGIFLRLIINARGVRINFEVVRTQNVPAYQNLNICELVDKIWTQGICQNITIDLINKTECSEANIQFPVLNVDYFDSCDVEGVCDLNFNPNNLYNADSCNDDYNFMIDIFDWQFVLYCNQEMIQSGYNGCQGSIQWYILEGIPRRVPFNRFGQYLNLDYIAVANELFLLNTYEQVIRWLLLYGFGDRNTKLVPPQLKSSLSKNITARNYSKTFNVGKILNNIINSTTNDHDVEYYYPPEAHIPWNEIIQQYGNNTNRSNFNTNSKTNVNTFNTSSNTTRNIQNYNSSNSRRVNQQNVVLDSNYETSSTQFSNNNTFTTNTSVYNTTTNSCEPITTAATNEFESVNKCPNCVITTNALQPLTRNYNNITPLTFTLNRQNASLSAGTRSSYLLRRRIVDGETEITPSNISILNGTAPGGFGGFGGGRNGISAYWNPLNGTTLSSANPSRLAYF